jgi:hypothetical protein
MRKLKNREVIAELKRIADRHGGILQPTDVVRAAHLETSPLHSHFTWDDNEAAEKCRLLEARQLINVVVEHVGGENNGRETHVFVSLKSDRAAAGGYRALIDVLSNTNLRDQLLRDSLESMSFFREKYQQLKELSTVFKAMISVEQRIFKHKRK